MRRLGSCTVPDVPELTWKISNRTPIEYGMIRGAPWAQQTIDEVIAEHFPGGRQSWTLVSKVVPGQTIPTHTDHQDGNCRNRIHVPLITDERCVFVTEGAEHHMACGFAYVIDPTTPHGVIHRGTQDRVHLMFNCHVKE